MAERTSLMGLILPCITADSGPELEVEILTGPHFPSPAFRVVNFGDETAHNLRLTDTAVVGNILYNNRYINIADSLVPDEMDIDSVQRFWMSMTVTCQIMRPHACLSQSDDEKNSIFPLR